MCPYTVFTALIHLTPDKMTTISQTTLSDVFIVKEKFRILIEISLKYVPKGPINNDTALI